jgi:hypothetical protein
MTHPADRFSYPTYIDAVVAGADRIDHERMNDWIDRWHEGQMDDHADLHGALGVTWEQYQTMMAPGTDEEKFLKTIVDARRAEIDGPQDRPISFRFGVPASSQESSMMNATMTLLEGGHAISVSLSPPKDMDVSDANVVRTTLSSVFRRIVDQGWKLEVSVGPNDADHQE